MKPSKLEEQIREILMLNYYGDGVVDADRLHGVVSDLMALFSQALSDLSKEIEEAIEVSRGNDYHNIGRGD